VHNGKITVA